jgi:Ca2+/Na+ antiporter
VSDTSYNTTGAILAFAAIVEAGTGLALMIDPVIVVWLLMGVDLAGVGILLGRCFGIALVALGLACSPSGPRAPIKSQAFRAMLTYNALIAVYLAYIRVVGHQGGLLLWPAILLHALVALLLIWMWHRYERAKAANR